MHKKSSLTEKEKLKNKVSEETKLTLEQAFDSPAGFAPAQAFIADDSGFLMLLCEPDKKAVLFKGASYEEIDTKPAGFHAIYRKENLLFYGILKHNAIGTIPLPGTALKGRPIVPGKLKPVSRNVTWKMFALSTSPCKILLIDGKDIGFFPAAFGDFEHGDIASGVDQKDFAGRS